MSTPTDAQVMIQNALEGLKALNKMEQIAEIISDTSAKEIADELNAMACVMAAAGAMPSSAEAVVRVLVEYIYRTMTSGTPFTDGKWKPYAAMTLEEVKAARKQVHEENMTDINVTDKQRNNPIVDDSAAGTIKNARCVFVALGYAQNCGSTGENLSTGLNLLSLCVHDALNVAELQSKEELPSPWINPIVEICVEATIENARKSLLGVQCVIQGNHDAMGEDYSLGMHFLLCCIDDAMETAILQSKAEERKAA